MPEQKKLTNAQIIARLRRSRNPKTADDLGGKDQGVTASRLRAMDGVVEVGLQHTGKQGRPRVLFTLNEAELTRSGAMSEQAASEDSAEQLEGVEARPEA